MASQLYFQAQFQPICKFQIEQIDNTIRRFLWNGGRSKVNKDIEYLPKDLGGLSLPNATEKLKTIRLKNLYEIYDDNHPQIWKHFAIEELNLISKSANLNEDIILFPEAPLTNNPKLAFWTQTIRDLRSVTKIVHPPSSISLHHIANQSLHTITSFKPTHLQKHGITKIGNIIDMENSSMTTPKYKDAAAIKKDFNLSQLPQKRLMNKLMEQLPQHTELENEYLINETTTSPSVQKIATRSFSEHKILKKKIRIENEVDIPDSLPSSILSPYQLIPIKVDPRTRVELISKDGRPHFFHRFIHRHLYRNLVIPDEEIHYHSKIWDDGTIIWPENWSRSRPLRNHPSINNQIGLLRLQLIHDKFPIGDRATHIMENDHVRYCPLCGDPNSTKHFFIECKYTIELWKYVNYTLSNICGRNIKLTPDNIILNVYPNDFRLDPFLWTICEIFSANLLLTLREEIHLFNNNVNFSTDWKKKLTRIIFKLNAKVMQSMNQTILQSQSRFHSAKWRLPALPETELISLPNWIDGLKALKILVDNQIRPSTAHDEIPATIVREEGLVVGNFSESVP